MTGVCRELCRNTVLFVVLVAAPGLCISIRGFHAGVDQNSSALVSTLASASTKARTAANTSQVSTFLGWYDAQHTGRGIWKWNNALEAYQRHFKVYAGYAANIAEVGVQSGGSILMWRSVLGEHCRIYGIDINPQCQQFEDASTYITVMDQGDLQAWNSFFGMLKSHVQSLDVLIDDGSHLAPHMLTTLTTAFPHIKQGGFVAIEDIHGREYVQSFFYPAASSISNWAAQGLVRAVHLYPFQMMVHKAGASPRPFVPGPPTESVTGFPELWPALNSHPGGFIFLLNPSWGSFLSESVLQRVFLAFAPLHDYAVISQPFGCEKTSSPVCTVAIKNSQSQQQIIGVHIFSTHLVVEVAKKPPHIAATRRGTDFLSYG